MNDETAPFWAALAEGRLDLPVCDACGHHIWYPRSWCPVCQHDAVTWTTLSGRGTVYARTILHKAMGPWGEAAPFVIAYVELDEGPRVLTNVRHRRPGLDRDRHRRSRRCSCRSTSPSTVRPPPTSSASSPTGLNRGSRFSTWAARPSSASPMPKPRNS